MTHYSWLYIKTKHTFCCFGEIHDLGQSHKTIISSQKYFHITNRREFTLRNSERSTGRSHADEAGNGVSFSSTDWKNLVLMFIP